MSHVNIISALPYEVKELIVPYLSCVDIYNLSFFCGEYEEIAFSNRKGTINCNSDLGLDANVAAAIFNSHPRLLQVTTVNLNGVYWISAADLRIFIGRLKNLEKAFLIGTKMGTTSDDCKVYCHLKKLKTLAVTIRHFTDNIPWDVFDGELIKVICGNHVLNYCGLCRLHEELYVVSRLKRSKLSRKIYWTDWMNEVCGYTTGPLRSRLEITYDDLSVHNTRINFMDIKELVISNTNSTIPEISLESLKDFKNLQNLHLELNLVVKPRFLKTLFTECSVLRRLTIKNYNPEFCLSHLHLAEKLEEISYETESNFDVNAFLEEILANNKLKMRRIWLVFDQCAEIRDDLLNTFMQNNPQLVFFGIYCNLPFDSIKINQARFDRHIINSQQIYGIFAQEPCLESLQNAHVDMINAYYVTYENLL